LQNIDLKGYIQSDGSLSTPTCCFLVNSLPNYAYTLPTADAVRGHNSARALIWQRAPGQAKRWTTKYPVYGIEWDMSLLLDPAGRLEMTAVATTTARLTARNSAFVLTARNGKTSTGTFQFRGGDVLFLDGVNLGNWVRTKS
jgi:hypothetical protein